MNVLQPWRGPRNDNRAAVRAACISLALLLLGTAEVTIALFARGTVEAAVVTAARLPVVGVDRLDALRRLIADRGRGLVDASTVQVEALSYPSFVAIRQPEPFTDTNRNGSRDPGEPYADLNGNGRWDADRGRAGTGGPDDVVVYRVTYQTRDVAALLRPVVGAITHTATVAVRNEPD